MKFSDACERNKIPILKVLSEELDSGIVLEIGSGTGQHSVFFSKEIPSIKWYPSETISNFESLNTFVTNYQNNNLQTPLIIDITQDQWIDFKVDYVFTSNTFHIINNALLTYFFYQSSKVMKSNGKLIIYGPFKFDNQFNSPSNQTFDELLKASDPFSGLKNFEEIVNIALKFDFIFSKKYEMPANNNILVFKKSIN